MITKPFRRGCAVLCALLLLPAVSAPGQGIITQAEPNDSIGTAHDTGLTAGTSGVKVAYGHTGDGPYGLPPGNGTGDVDFYKLTANAGQTIFINVNNAGIDPDFDGYVGIYNAAGELQKALDANGNPILDDTGNPVDIDGVDDAGNTSRGYDRTPKVAYKVPASGTYYVYVGNWIQAGSSPVDPFTPGTSLGLPSGKAGPYQLIIGLDVAVPVPQFIAGSTGYPVPAYLPEKVFGTPRYDGTLTISNTSPGATPGADLVISSYNVTGPDAARFIIKGLVTPARIKPGEELNVKVSFNAGGSPSQAQAVLNFVSNDPFNQPFVLDTLSSPVIGGGVFAVRQVNSTAGVGSLETADQLLAGTIAGTTYTGTTSRINYGSGNQRHWGNDLPFLNGGTDPNNIALQVTGTFRVRSAGTYSFMSTADDGHRLRINGTDVILQPNYQDADFFGNIELPAGNHTLEYTMYEGTGGNHAELSISQKPGAFTSYIATTWELLEAAGADSDNDDLPDAYEVANGLNPNSAAGADGPAGDPDADGSTNIQEYVNGTNPQVADTDGDGLLDGVETDSGNYVSTSDTGTSPLIADTDNDGLLDGVENPALPTTGPGQPGTSPVKKDTDGDGYADLTEISLGSDPKLASSVPAPFTYVNALFEDFDGGAVNSSYILNRITAAGSEPMVIETGTARGMVAQLTSATNSNHNSLTFDYVDLPSVPVVKISVDFKMMNNSNPADGFGIGLFRKGAYGTAGISPGITGTPPWENATYANALMFGFSVYGTDVVRVTGPATPTVNLASFNPPVLTNDKFNRAVITVLANGTASSMVKLEIIYDIDGTPVTQVIFDNVLVPGFTITNEDFRLIAGGRTGSLNVDTQLDNISVAIPVQTASSLVLANTLTSFTADLHDGSAAIVTGGSVTATLNGNPITVTSPKSGSVTKVVFAGAAGAFFTPGENTVVFNYTTSAGPVTESRIVTMPAYKLLNPALALPVSHTFIPGFNFRMVQGTPFTSGTTAPNLLDYAEGTLDGVIGLPWLPGNNADLAGTQEGYFREDVLNYEQSAVSYGYFGGDSFTPGLPGIVPEYTDNYVVEALTWIEFPAEGIYQLGVNADDGFRLSATHAPVPALAVTAPAGAVRSISAYPSFATAGGAFGPYPVPPVVRPVVLADPVLAGPIDTPLLNAAAIAGNIALIDRGTHTFAIKVKNAQNAGALAVIICNNEANQNGFPGLMAGDAAVTGITIPAVMISKADGDYLKTLLAAPGGLQMQFGPDESTTLGKNNVNGITAFNVAVSVPGLYPIRFFNFEGGGGANAELYSTDAYGVRHLVNDTFDAGSLKAYSAVSPDPAAILMTKSRDDLLIYYKGVLQSSTDLAAPNAFMDVSNAYSPYIVPAGGPPRLFFRARP